MEEGLLLQLHNPSHTDSGRIAVPLGAVCGIAMFFLYGAIFDQLVGYFQTLIGMLTAFCIGIPTYRLLQQWKESNLAKKNENMRQMREEETQRQLADMKKKRI
mgnify:FL=1